MPRRAAAGARRRAEFGAGLAGVGRLEDLAAAARDVERRLARLDAVGAKRQRFRAVHFVQMRLMDAGLFFSTARGLPLTPTLSP